MHKIAIQNMRRPVHIQNHGAILHPKLVFSLQSRQSRSNPSQFADTAESNVLNYNTEYYKQLLECYALISILLFF